MILYTYIRHVHVLKVTVANITKLLMQTAAASTKKVQQNTKHN